MAEVTVSIATYNTPPSMLRRAVESVLIQSCDDLELWIVDDASHHPFAGIEDIDDPRIQLITRDRNSGRYAIDHMVVAMTDSPFWAPLDSDDWAEPNWISALMERSSVADVVFCHHAKHRKNQTTIEKVKHWDGSPHLQWHAHLSGLWRVEWLRDVGITTEGMRVAWDTVMTSVPWLLGRTKVIDAVLVHRDIRPGSLTTSPETGRRSKHRADATRTCQRAWKEIVANPSRCAEIVRSLTGVSDRHSAAGVIRNIRTDNWALPRATIAELDRRLHELAPRTILECGSGESTRILAMYAANTGAKVISLEHDPNFHRRTKKNLNGLTGVVDLRLAPLRDGFYRTELPDDIDFVLIDGPPARTGGRSKVGPAIAPHLAERFEIWLDDGNRDDERTASERWVATGVLPKGTTRHVTGLPHRPIVMSKGVSPIYADVVDAHDVTITLLTGARPDLLELTLLSLPDQLFATADRVVALVNGDDIPTRQLLDRPEEWSAVPVNVDIIETAEIIPTGPAVSMLAKEVVSSYWLHLEDDWGHCTLDHTWLDAARDVLSAEPDVGQIRLRHISEDVRDRHQVTNTPIRWQLHRCGLVADDAHWTWNPTLVRTTDARKLYPTNTERTLQSDAGAHGFNRVVQLTPGAFFHIGTQNSLRARTGG